jgi:hypothetical protein
MYSISKAVTSLFIVSHSFARRIYISSLLQLPVLELKWIYGVLEAGAHGAAKNRIGRLGASSVDLQENASFATRAGTIPSDISDPFLGGDHQKHRDSMQIEKPLQLICLHMPDCEALSRQSRNKLLAMWQVGFTVIDQHDFLPGPGEHFAIQQVLHDFLRTGAASREEMDHGPAAAVLATDHFEDAFAWRSERLVVRHQDCTRERRTGEPKAEEPANGSPGPMPDGTR